MTGSQASATIPLDGHHRLPRLFTAIRMELRFIGYRKKNWMDNMVDTEVNGPGFYETGVNWVTDQRELTSDSGTCTAGWYKYHFTPRSNVTLLMTDRKGDARFVATHVLLEVEDGPATSTPTPSGNPPPPTQVVPPTSSGDPTHRRAHLRALRHPREHRRQQQEQTCLEVDRFIYL